MAYNRDWLSLSRCENWPNKQAIRTSCLTSKHCKRKEREQVIYLNKETIILQLQQRYLTVDHHTSIFFFPFLLWMKISLLRCLIFQLYWSKLLFFPPELSICKNRDKDKAGAVFPSQVPQPSCFSSQAGTQSTSFHACLTWKKLQEMYFSDIVISIYLIL